MSSGAAGQGLVMKVAYAAAAEKTWEGYSGIVSKRPLTKEQGDTVEGQRDSEHSNLRLSTSYWPGCALRTLYLSLYL